MGVRACVGEAQADGCERDDATWVDVYIIEDWDVHFDGRRGCDDHPTGTAEYSHVRFHGLFTFSWYDERLGDRYSCWMYFAAYDVWVLQPCAAPPPNPGWGHLLP